MQVPFLCGQKCRSENRGRDRTNLRSRQPRRWGHIRDECRHLVVISLLSLQGLGETARTQHDQPFRLLDTGRVGLGVSQRLPLGILSLLDLVLGTVSDEDGLASPLDNDLSHISPRKRASIGNGRRTFLPSGMAARSISTLAWASTSAEADMLTRKSGWQIRQHRLPSSRSRRNPSAKQPIGLRCHLRPSKSPLYRVAGLYRACRGVFTLHSRLRAHTRQSAHGTNHKVLDEPGALLTL